MTMSLIEQAANRLEELRRAGIEVPVHTAGPEEVRDDSPEGIEGRRPSSRKSTSRRVDLDLRKLAEVGFVTPDNPRSRIADEFRIIKRPLIANAEGKGATPIANGNLVMVTSALPGEGKTFLSINLAMSIAMEQDRTVLLVDADVARPSIPRTFGLPEMPGLLDLIDNPSLDVADVLVRTNVEKLAFLSSGKMHPRAAEMLASESMSDLLGELASRYDDRIVIFDSPPLLVTTEARVMASKMGQVVFVVQANQTLQGDVLRALATIQTCDIKQIVLNKARSASQGTYGYGYGYGYGP